jgi:ribosomal protein S21
MSDTHETKKTIILPENVPVDYNFERMLKSFMRQVDKMGILREVKARRYYIKPSEQKRLAKKTRRK